MGLVVLQLGAFVALLPARAFAADAFGPVALPGTAQQLCQTLSDLRNSQGRRPLFSPAAFRRSGTTCLSSAISQTSL
jgi:hypothetical protein